MHDVGAPTACRRAWRVLWTTCRSQSADNIESRGPVGAEAEPLWGVRRARVPRLQEPRKWIAEARRVQLVLYVDSKAIGTRT